MRVTELANAMNTTPDTVRYYTKIKFITPSKNPDNGYKNYGESAQNRLKFILSARQLNFSVTEIKSILIESDKGHTACPMVRDIIVQHLNETEKQFQAALLLREKLKNVINEWQNKPDKAPTGHMICHLIEGEFEGETLNISSSDANQGDNHE
ncbi:MerR family transcriptional regulator [Cognaticolwellia beringensis]|uniref:MerR family transcriptional regulator n=1 Tax=Cognaticolwellia beringensis TaxID=1967665 RepID=A0A222GBM0_9GAMM|nr:MerR family DNA-binding protein [Cognaticolwellia beringensis]ASP49279.1 MerR family transcriptional regulator [Cognaticolwellia beringensis]